MIKSENTLKPDTPLKDSKSSNARKDSPTQYTDSAAYGMKNDLGRNKIAE